MTVDTKLNERSRKNQSILLQRLAQTTQTTVALRLEVSESTVSRWVSKDLQTTAETLAALGVKVVPEEVKCFDPEHVERLRYFAEIGIKHAKTPAQELEWD